MKRWKLAPARLAYWLACVSPLSIVWMALAYSPTHPRHLPPLPVQILWWTLVLYAPLSATIGSAAWIWIWCRGRSRQGLTYAQAATVIGVLATGAIAYDTDSQHAMRITMSGGGEACLSNQKQLALSLLMYAQDYDGRFPLANSWTGESLPYNKNTTIYHCPREQVTGVPSYAMNRHLPRVLADSIDKPATTVMLIDAAPGANRLVGGEDYPFTDRHDTFLIAAFADGHAKRRSMEDASGLQWAPQLVQSKKRSLSK